MFDDSDTDDDIFPSMPSNINFQERPKFKQPYDLVDLEHQLILADGLVKPLVPLSTATATAMESPPTTTTPTADYRERSLLQLYEDVRTHALSLSSGEYMRVLRSKAARFLFGFARFGPGSSQELLQRDSDAWLLRKEEQSALALRTGCDIQTNAAQYILTGIAPLGDLDIQQEQKLMAGGDDAADDSDSDDDDDAADWLADIIDKERRVRALLVTMVGAACLNSFVQQNWTGPPLEVQGDMGIPLWLCSTTSIIGSDHADIVQQRQDVRLALEIGGDRAFYKCELPELLLIGRSLLSTVASGGSSLGNATWNFRPKIRSTSGGGKKMMSIDPKDRATLKTICSTVSTARWWHVRACVIHHRTLIYDVEGNQDLKQDITGHYEILLSKYSCVVDSDQSEHDGSSTRRRLAAQVELEYGLAQHHWGDVDGGKLNFERAKIATGLTTLLTGFRGRKTKYQSFDTQHLVVVAHSTLDEIHEKFTAPQPPPPLPLPLLPEEKMDERVKSEEEALGMGGRDGGDGGGGASADASASSADASAAASASANDGATNDDDGNSDSDEEYDELKHAKTTLTGVKEYSLNEVDPDNIVLESIKYTDEAYDNGGSLSLFDQCIILALCLDVKNSNPKNGLTSLEMQPYILRVMEGSENMNWMIHTSALVVRAWLEFEVNRTKSRAIMQLQAIVDQFVNKLSAGQQAGSDYYAPAIQRMRYVYVLPLPSYWETRRDLAQRYMSLHVKHSALKLYEELEMWEDVVQCYIDLEKDQEAKELVRERLRIQPSPMLYCVLGELEDDDKHFRTAWLFSGKRYARALRLLGGRRDRAEDAEGALACYLEATGAAPSNYYAWWRVGNIAMGLKRYDLAATAWTNVVRIAPKDGQARANLGATFTKMLKWEEAYQAFNGASSLEYRNWRVWENKLFCSARTGRYAEAISSQRRVVELRRNRKGHPMDWMVLRKMTAGIIASEMQVRRRRREEGGGKEEGGGEEKKKKEEEDLSVSLEKSKASGGNDAVGAIEDGDLSRILPSMMPSGDESEMKREVVVGEIGTKKKEEEEQQQEEEEQEEEEEDIVDSDGLPACRHLQRLENLFVFAVEHVYTSHEVWECYAEICLVTKNYPKLLECREKGFRALERGEWVESQASAEQIAEAAMVLSACYALGGDEHRGGMVVKTVIDKLVARGKEVDGLKAATREMVVEEEGGGGGGGGGEGLEKKRTAAEEDQMWRTALIQKLQEAQ